MHRSSRRVTAVLVGILGACVITTAPPAIAQPDDPQVDALLHARIVNPRIGQDVGMIVIDAASGAIVSSVDPDARMLPASNMKIVTAVTALTSLGATAQLSTRVLSTASPNELVLQGGGDPLLSTSDLERLARKAARTLTAGVPVSVRVDASLFPMPDRAPGWTPTYIPSVAAPVEALARIGDYSRDPSGNAATVFVRELRSLGFPAHLGDPITADASSAVVAESSSTVDDAISVMLSDSENNIAEVLFRQVAIASGLPPTWEGARQAAVQVLGGLGIDASGMKLLDGSGLSRRDRVSPRFLADVLRLARVTKPQPYTAMFDPEALPVSGRTGTLATAYGRYVTRHSRCAQGQVHAKTGSLFDTIALSGVAETTTGGERLFSILVNDRPQRYSALSTRQALDGLTATMTGCWA